MAQARDTDHPAAKPTVVHETRRELIFAFSVMLAGLVLRLYHLGKASLWTDEILFVQLAALKGTMLDVYRAHLQSFMVVSHLPLPAMVVHLFTQGLKPFISAPLDQVPFLLRLPSVLWGSVGIPLCYLFLKQVVSGAVARAGTVFYATFFFPIFYAREAYVYAPLMCLGNLGLYLVMKSLVQDRISLKRMLALFLCMVALLHTHLTGAVWVMMCVFICLVWTVRTPIRSSEWSRKQKNSLWVCVVGLAATVTALPFYGQYLGKEQSLVFPDSQGMIANLNDALGKMWLGVHPVATLTMWILLLVAQFYFIRLKKRKASLVFVWVWTLSCLALITVFVHLKQYSSRYFIIVLPGFYLMLSCGVYQVSEWVKSLVKPPKVGTYVYACSVLLPTLLHLLFFLPLFYRLQSKSVNFKGIAEWLNEYVQPGDPYLMESGYELRFVSGYYPTPGLVAACPYVHGHGPEEMKKLRELQAGFIRRFPETTFVESARHGTAPGSSYSAWTWPHRYFKHKAVLRNDSLKKLKQAGIWPQIFGRDSVPQENEVFIWYNKPEDTRAIALERGDLVLCSFEAWTCRELQRGAYARWIPYTQGEVNVENLKGKELRGKFVITAALSAPEQSFDVDFMLDDRPLGRASKWGGTFWSHETPEILLSPGFHTLRWGVKEGALDQLQGLLLYSLEFEGTSGSESVAAEENADLLLWTPPAGP